MTQIPLIHANGRVLAAIDPSPYASSVADHAGWAAARLSAPLKLLHTLEKRVSAPVVDLSGNITLGGQEALLAELAQLDARRMTLEQAQGRALLDAMRAQVESAHGVVADVRQRHGAVLESLLEVEAGVRLFVMGKRGENSGLARDHLGSNLERVLRAVHRPVLVAPRTFNAPTTFVIAFDGSTTTRRCVEMVCASPLLHGFESHVVSVGAATTELTAQRNWALDSLAPAGFAPTLHVATGHTEDVIAELVERVQAGLLVMGAYGHSRIRRLVLGSTTTQLLMRCHVPVLLLR